MCSFDNIKPAELTTSETQFMSNLLNELPYTIASGKSIEENRKKVNAHKDKNFDDRKEDDVSLDEINKGLRIIEVLGQILKNRAGSFEKSNVQEILEHTIDLGLRIMNLFLGTCRKPEFVDYLVSQLEEEEKENTSSHKFSRDKKKELVEKNIQIFGYMITVGMINRITYAISSDKLTDEAAILSDKRNTPAYQIIDYLLCQLEKGIDVNKLEKTYSGFEKSKNFWAKRTLSYYVQSYLNTHRLPFKKRQKTYNILGITKYIPNKI